MEIFFSKNFTLHTLSFGEVGCRNDYVKVSGHSIQGKWSLTDHFCAKGVNSRKKITIGSENVINAIAMPLHDVFLTYLIPI